MFTTSALKKMPYAQAKVRREPNRVTLISYTTTVAEIVGGVLMVYGLYSATTRRHISAFMREFGLDYQIAKKCYTNSLTYDIVTHEWVSLLTGEIVD